MMSTGGVEENAAIIYDSSFVTYLWTAVSN